MLVAEAQFYKGDYKKALDAYEKYLDNTARADPGLLFRAGYAHYAAGNTAKAIEYLDQAAAAKDTVSYYASYYLGILYLKQGNKPYAMNAFNYAKKNPADAGLAEESSFQFAKVSYDAGKPDLAINEFESFLSEHPNSTHAVEVKELLAQAYVNGNNFNKAIEYIDALPSRNPYINQAYQKAAYLKGAELFNKGDYSESVEFFSKSLTYPIDQGYVALASFWSGEAYSLGGKYDEAAEHYLRVIKANTDADLVLKARYALGYSYFNQQQYDKAMVSFSEFANKGNKSTANYSDGLIRLADCYYVNKRYSDALTYYTRVHTMGSPDNDYVLFQSGVIYGIQKKYTESKRQFVDLIRAYPRSQYRDEAMFQQAQFEIEQGNYQAAIDGLTDLIRVGANSRFLPYAFMRRGASYFNLKQYDRTIADYTAVINQFPAHPVAQEALLPLQEALSIAGRSGEFEKHLTLVKRANPDNKGLESLEFETAKNLYFDQQYQKAVTNLSAFTREYPQSSKVAEAKYYTAEAHYRLREFDNALPIYRVLSSDPTFTMANRTVGRIAEIEFKQGKYSDAVASFHAVERLAENKKDQYNAWSGLMESFFLLAQYDSADKYARIILEQGNVNAGAQNKASLYLGKSAMARGDFDTAKDEFLNTLNAARDEHGAEAKYLLAKIFHQQKSYKQCYETLVSLNNDFAAYEDWVGKSYLLLADNFAAMGDIFQAKGTLQSLVDHFPQQAVKDEAKRKLRLLEEQQLEQKPVPERDSVENDG
jgi:TolA-binding protein